MIRHGEVNQTQLLRLLKSGLITLAGNQKLKIYGQLNCSSGKRMKIENRVFFVNNEDAIAHGFRPCGYCIRIKYQRWKLSKKQVEKP